VSLSVITSHYFVRDHFQLAVAIGRHKIAELARFLAMTISKLHAAYCQVGQTLDVSLSDVFFKSRREIRHPSLASGHAYFFSAMYRLLELTSSLPCSRSPALIRC